jgi:hypothetical protein
MKTIVVSDVTYALVANAAIHPFISTGRQLPSGQWEVPVSDDVYTVLTAARVGEESIDDTIQRVLVKERH